MKPGDHPDFFKFPAPFGRSRESTIKLDQLGRFYHEGERIELPRMQRAFASWLQAHPEDGRFILSNGYDWTYVHIEDAPFVVNAAKLTDCDIQLSLNDGTVERLEPGTLRLGKHPACEHPNPNASPNPDALYCAVKNRQYVGKLKPSAQLALSDALLERDGSIQLKLGSQTFPLLPSEPAE